METLDDFSRPFQPASLGKAQTMLDSQLADRAQVALEQNPHLPRRLVQLETQDGRVILKGTVKSYFQKQMAQESLRRIEGVEEIENQLQVHWS